MRFVLLLCFCDERNGNTTRANLFQCDGCQISQSVILVRTCSTIVSRQHESVGNIAVLWKNDQPIGDRDLFMYFVILRVLKNEFTTLRVTSDGQQTQKYEQR